MTSRSGRLLSLGVLVLAPLAVAKAGTVHGTVINGTTGKAAAGIELTLVQLQGGMQEVAHQKSDAQGQFTFDNPGLGAQPMLVRAVYHGIHFNQAVPPGSSTVQVEIYEASKDAKTINVTSHVVIFQPNGATLIVGEEYQIENRSQPQQAYFRTDGNFDFALPEKGALQQVAAAGPAGMPVVQLPIDKKNNRYSIAFAFRPGQSSVRYSYELPYTGNAATVKIPTVYPGGRLLVVAPPSVQIRGEGLAPGGQEQGMNLYGREDVPAGTLVAVNISGTAPPPSEAGAGADQGQQGRDAQQGGGESVAAALPADENPPGAKPKKPKPASAGAVPAPPVVSGSSNGAASVAEVDAAIGTSLDSLKDRLFRLELRRQAGTISEEEYARERARAEKVLRDLVRG